MADGGDEEGGCDGVGWVEFGVFAAGDSDGCFPRFAGVVPVAAVDRGIEADVFVELVFVCDGLEIGEDFFLTGIFARPVRVLIEGEGIKV